MRIYILHTSSVQTSIASLHALDKQYIVLGNLIYSQSFLSTSTSPNAPQNLSNPSINAAFPTVNVIRNHPNSSGIYTFPGAIMTPLFIQMQFSSHAVCKY